MKTTGSKPELKAEHFDAYRLMVMWLFIATFAACVITFVLVFPFESVMSDTNGGTDQKTVTTKATALVTVILAGILGSFVSALNRIYSFRNIFPDEQYQAFFKKGDVYLVIYSSIPPMVGAIAAVVLYLVFAGGLINGALFPEFACGNLSGCDTFANFVDHWKPKGPTDYARAIVWGFLAGFSERLVPDILNRISATSKGDADGV